MQYNCIRNKELNFTQALSNQIYYETYTIYFVGDTYLDPYPAGRLFRLINADAGRSVHADSLSHAPRHPGGDSTGDAGCACRNAGTGCNCRS